MANAGNLCQAALAGLGYSGCLVFPLKSRDLTEFPGLSWLAVKGEVRHGTCPCLWPLSVVDGMTTDGDGLATGDGADQEGSSLAGVEMWL